MTAILTVHDKFNSLIAKDDVGKAKCMYYPHPSPTISGTANYLPGSDFTYGMPSLGNRDTVRGVTSEWREHVPSKARVDSNSVNFMKLNGVASWKPEVSAKMINAEAKRIKAKQAKAGTTDSQDLNRSPTIPSDSIPRDMAFGLASEKSTPLMDIIQNKFGSIGEAEALGRYQRYYDQREMRNHTETTVRQTKSSLALQSSTNSLRNAGEEKPLFKMKKFLRVPAKVNRHWNAADTVPNPEIANPE